MYIQAATQFQCFMNLTVHDWMQIKNVAAASNAALQHDVASLQKETQQLQTKLEKSLQSFDTVQQEAQAVEGEVVDEVQLFSSFFVSLILFHCCSLHVTCTTKHFCISLRGTCTTSEVPMLHAANLSPDFLALQYCPYCVMSD